MISPPMMAIANGWCICDPLPNPRASGNRAVMAPRAVIRAHLVLSQAGDFWFEACFRSGNDDPIKNVLCSCRIFKKPHFQLYLIYAVIY